MGDIRNEGLESLRARTLDAARAADRRMRRRHRIVAVLAAVATVAVLTAGGVALTAPPPPPPLPADREMELYQGGVEERWAELQAQYPDAVRPDAQFERFITRDEEAAVVSTCLRAQGIPATIDEHGVGYTLPPGDDEDTAARQQELDLAVFACEVRFPLSPSLSQPFTDDELRFTYRYFVDELTPCLTALGHDIGAPPSFDEFRERWWTDDPWSPYRDVVDFDADGIEGTWEACPPMPPGLRP